MFVTYKDIEFNNIGTDAAKDIAKALMNMRYLTTLSILMSWESITITFQQLVVTQFTMHS